MFLVELIASSFIYLISKQARRECRCKRVLVDNRIAFQIASSSRNANDRTFSSIFLFRITLAAIISSNRNLFTLKLYRHFCPKIFSMKACNLCSLDLLKTDFEKCRATSGLTLEANCKFATFLNVANPLILCTPPQVVAERTRSDLAISQTRSGVTTSKPNQADK